MNNCNYRPIWHRYRDIDIQHFCNHGYIFERRFSPIFLQERIIFMIWVVRDYVKDHVSFYLKSLAQKIKVL